MISSKGHEIILVIISVFGLAVGLALAIAYNEWYYILFAVLMAVVLVIAVVRLIRVVRIRKKCIFCEAKYVGFDGSGFTSDGVRSISIHFEIEKDGNTIVLKTPHTFTTHQVNGLTIGSKIWIGYTPDYKHVIIL